MRERDSDVFSTVCSLLFVRSLFLVQSTSGCYLILNARIVSMDRWRSSSAPVDRHWALQRPCPAYLLSSMADQLGQSAWQQRAVSGCLSGTVAAQASGHLRYSGVVFGPSKAQFHPALMGHAWLLVCSGTQTIAAKFADIYSDVDKLFHLR